MGDIGVLCDERVNISLHFPESGETVISAHFVFNRLSRGFRLCRFIFLLHRSDFGGNLLCDVLSHFCMVLVELIAKFGGILIRQIPNFKLWHFKRIGDCFIYSPCLRFYKRILFRKLLLKLLYHPEIQCGMEARECAAVIQRLYY